MIAPKRAFFLVVGLMILGACAVEVGGPADDVSYYDASGKLVYVDDYPPPPRSEIVVGPAPSPSHVWVGGYWAWRRGGWQWVDGRWVARPRPNAVWVPGHWEQRPRGHVWVSGYWR